MAKVQQGELQLVMVRMANVASAKSEPEHLAGVKNQKDCQSQFNAMLATRIEKPEPMMRLSPVHGSVA